MYDVPVTGHMKRPHVLEVLSYVFIETRHLGFS
jgi:hypothetical protein